MSHSFPRDASLVLMGMRSSGKSSLASIAAKALQWKVIDEKLQFQKATGYSVGGYIETHGLKAYCAREVAILRSIIVDNPRCCIIVCSSSCVETQAGRDLLLQHLSMLPVIHVMRDRDILRTHLESKWKGDVAKVLRNQEPVYFGCSNFTFFNADVSMADSDLDGGRGGLFETITSPSNRPTSQSLSLKHVESEFLRFLGSIYGRADEYDFQIPARANSFNYALQLPFSDLKHYGSKLESLVSCADVLEIRTGVLLQGYLNNRTADQQAWWVYLVEQLGFLRRHTSQPILYHAEPPTGDAAALGLDYFDLVRLGLRIGAELVSIDLQQDESHIKSLAQNKGHCKFVGWYHDPDPTATGGWMGQNRLRWYEKAMYLGFDMLHLTQPAVSPSDNLAARCFARNINERGSLLVAAYNTGHLGRPSQCFNKLLTLVRHPDVTEDETETVTILQAQGALFSSFTYEPLRFSVMGANVRYSLAPTLFNCAFEVYGMPHNYSIAQINTFDLLESMTKDQQFGGLGLSAPFKTSIMPRLDSMSIDVKSIGAANTIVPIRRWIAADTPNAVPTTDQQNRAGSVVGLHGENTDWVGIKSCTLRHLSPANAITSSSTALIIGAGGMARAAIYALIRAGIQNILIYNRTHQRAVALVHHFEGLYDRNTQIDENDKEHLPTHATFSTLENLQEPWPIGLRLPTVVVNCSPVPGSTIVVTSPTPQDSVGPGPLVSVPDQWLRSPTGGVYVELAYINITPSPELLRISSGENKGWVGVPGLEIFLETLAAQFRIWTGRRPPKHIMKTRVIQHITQMMEAGS